MRGDEARIINAFCGWLESQGWRTDSEVDYIDVIAERDAATVHAEAKGRTSTAWTRSGWSQRSRQACSSPRLTLIRLPRSGHGRDTEDVSRFVDDIRRARAEGRLGECFRPDDVRRACPGWADHTYGVFLPKHRPGNPGGYTPYFRQNLDGSYSLLG